MFQLLITDHISLEQVASIINPDEAELIVGSVKDAHIDLNKIDGILVRSATKVREDLLEKMPNLKIIGRAGVGVDTIDVAACTKRGILVVNAPNGNTTSTAEHTFAMMMSLLRNIPQANISVKSNEWNRSAFIGRELYGKTLGIAGLGKIGVEVMKRAKVFGMKVLAFDPFLTEERAKQLQVQAVTIDELLTLSDIITVHTPLTKETYKLINAENLALTKKGIFLINCARGGIIDEQAIIQYINNGTIAGVALDVFENEPLLNHQLVEKHEVIVTPHIAASTVEAQENVATQVAEDIARFISNLPVQNAVNIPSMTKEDFVHLLPFMELAEKMGTFLAYSIDEPITELKIAYEGELSQYNTDIVTKHALVGLLKRKFGSRINVVNATMVAKESQFTYGESFTPKRSGYTNCLTIRATAGKKQHTVKGTSFAELGGRVVSVNDYEINFEPTGTQLFIHHLDKIGMIGRVGTILGKVDVNIASMDVGRKQVGGKAVMIITVDKDVPTTAIEELKKLDNIITVKQIDMD
ncbi:MAG: phosphoglycerate dehydrogenase [Bacillaceae bacterium]